MIDSASVVPVVMGARLEDYRLVAPPQSFIHVDEFDGPAALAVFLHRVAADDRLYNSYFRWRSVGQFIDTKFWCRVCALTHEASRTDHRTAVDRLDHWWRGRGVCVTPRHPRRWARWKNE